MLCGHRDIKMQEMAPAIGKNPKEQRQFARGTHSGLKFSQRTVSTQLTLSLHFGSIRLMVRSFFAPRKSSVEPGEMMNP